MTKLTTHCLDTFSGKPAKGVKVDIYFITDKREKLNSIVLNNDGRAEEPLLEGNSFKEGQYELVFFVGDYFKRITDLPKTPFLNEIIIKFGVSNPKEHYHVPLLVTPWSYSTYRGS
ncbi:MAG TPA: hydroxyisourate hydrolase [Pelagibacteraceae bacterium]|jgi:5-hydroxyisourate hydrolase|nr:hydroxyisourate hydrolase [Pelagibacteraceae bacterium]|tara:strand:- start:1382 stop:1729 length:348 start_codon:yes stop_codon:yes gene_type:complete